MASSTLSWLATLLGGGLLSGLDSGNGSYTALGEDVTLENYADLFTDLNAEQNAELTSLLSGQASSLTSDAATYSSNIQNYLTQALSSDNWTGVSDLVTQLSTGTYAGSENLQAAADLAQSNTWMNNFLASSKDLQNLVSGATGSLESSWKTVLSNYSKQAVSDVGAELAGMGALYSGALGSLVGTKVGEKAAEASTDIATTSANLYGTLATQAMSGYSTQQTNAVNALLEAASLGQTGTQSALSALLTKGQSTTNAALSAASTYEGMYGTNVSSASNLLSSLTNLQSEWVAPDVTYEPSFLEKLSSIFTDASSLASLFA